MITLVVACSGPADRSPPAPVAPPPSAPPPAPTGRPVSQHPSVVLIIVDTLRADRLSTYGHDRPTSAALTGLADGAVRYERSHSVAPWTKPSIGAILTSTYPSQIGLIDKLTAIPPQAKLLPEVLAEAGYRTGAIISHTYLGSRYGFNQGYELFDESNVEGELSTPSRGVTEDAVAFIDAHVGQPFFLLVHYFDPHFAYIEREGFPHSASEGYKGPVRSGIEYGRMRQLVSHLEPPDVSELLRIYDTEIAATDRSMGRIFSRVLDDPRLADTMIVVTADHGEEFLDHGRWGHTTRLFEELLHVPLVIRYPDGRSGVVSEPVSSIDIMPTILSAVHLDPPRITQGADLAAGVAADRPVFSETASSFRKDSVIVGDLKLIHDRDEKRWWLYDLGADPGERKNLVDSRPEDAARLRALLAEWEEKVRRGKTLKAADVHLSRDEQQALEKLGYVDP